MTRSRSVLCSKILAGSSLIMAMIGVSACTSTPGTQSLAVSSPRYTPVRVAYNDAPADLAADTAAQPVRVAQTDIMPIGDAVPAPMGFLDLCQRSPVDCTHSSDYDPQRIRTLARAATVERYRVAFAALHPNPAIDADADLQSAAISQPAPAETSAPAATAGDARYLSWPGQTGPVSYVQPLQHGLTPGLKPLPGLVAPAANGFVSDFLDLSVNPGGSTQLGLAAPIHLIGDIQPGAIADGAGDMATLNWSHKSDDTGYSAIVPVSTDASRAPSIQYDIPNEPFDWAHVHLPAPAAAQAQPDAMAAVEPARNDAGTTTADYTRIELTAGTAHVIRSVNDEVNRIMRGATDEQVYHVADYWNAPPLTPGVRGDCEDFALEKRRLLISNGVPAAALSIAIVRTRLGDDHAVLIVSTRQGDLVLDNLQYDVRPWRKADYTWVSRQGPGDDLSWVSLAPANDRTRSPWQTRTLRVAYAR